MLALSLISNIFSLAGFFQLIKHNLCNIFTQAGVLQTFSTGTVFLQLSCNIILLIIECNIRVFYCKVIFLSESIDLIRVL